ncbi:MAG TPA: response regulator transcription factor [Chitinophagaceae bacterium]|nr:response regulator transcription factor [Chitinophagaceae bacterium]HUM64568.1 response regulator transcription factor [Chitinophagaceae bacterium]
MIMANDKDLVLVVEDELITAESIRELLEEEDYIVIGIAKDADSALRLSRDAEQPPGVVVCDINIKGEVKGVELAGRLRKQYGCEIIFLTAYTDTQTLESAFETEPVMYVVKPYNDTQLRVAVQMAFHKILKKEKAGTHKILDLTEREREIAGLVAQGNSSKQIARKLSISVETVKTHRRRMLSKNNISSFPHLVFLMKNGL